MGGGGKGGGARGLPGQEELGRLLQAELYSTAIARKPQLAGAFRPGTELGKSYQEIFGAAPVAGPGIRRPQTFGEITRQARTALGYQTPAPGPGYYGTPTQGGSTFGQDLAQKAFQAAQGWKATQAGKGGAQGGVPPQAGQFQGAGQLVPQPGGPGPAGGQAAPTPVTRTTPITPVEVPGERQRLLGQVGAEQIGRQARMGMQDVMRLYGRRGLGRSGLPLQAMQQQFERGAGAAQSQLARQLAAERMGREFSAAQQAQQLEARRQMGERELGVREILGLGGLGLQERQQALAEIAAQQQAEGALLPILGGLGQSIIAAGADRGGGGKGGK